MSMIVRVEVATAGEDKVEKLERTLDATVGAAKKVTTEVTKMGTSVTGAATAATKAHETARTAAEAAKKAAEAAAAAAKKAADEMAAAARRASEAAAAAAKAMGDALGTLGKNFATVGAQFEREAVILERIQAPMREYIADVRALNALFEKGVISAKQYDEQLATIDRRAGVAGPAAAPAAPEEKQHGIGDVVKGAMGGAAGLAGMFGFGAIVSGLQMVVDKFTEWRAESSRLKDIYIEASNAAVKFVDANRDVNRVIEEQVRVAGRLHSNYATTIDMYDAVRDGTDGLNYSHNDQIRLLETIGKAVQVAGKSMGSAAGLVQQLSYAASRGTIEQRQMNTIMRQVPEIADLWTSHFRVGKRELLNLVQQGKIGVHDLINVLVTDGAKIDEAFKKIKKTSKQIKEEFAANVELFRGQGMGYLEALTKASEISDAPVEKLLKEQGPAETMAIKRGAMQRGMKSELDVIQAFIGAAEDAAAAVERASDAMAGKFMRGVVKMVEAIPTAVGKLNDLGTTIGRLAGYFNDPWGSDKTGFAAQMKLMTSFKTPIEDAKLELQNLNALLAKGTINAEEYRTKYLALMTAINDGRLPEALKIMEGINEPVRQYARTLDALNGLLHSNTISQSQYNAELGRTIKMLGEEYHQEDLQRRAIRGVPVGGRKIGGVEVGIGAEVTEDQPKQRESVFAAAGATREATTFTREYAEALQREFAVAQSLQEPLRIYEQAIAAINGALEKSMLTQQQATELTRRATKAYKDASDALEAPAGVSDMVWKKMAKDAESFDQQLANSITSDIDKLNDALLTMAQGGEVAWGNMIESMLLDLEKLIIKQLEVAAINAIITAATGGVPVPGVGGAVAGASGGGGTGTATSGLTANSGPGAYPLPTAGVATSASTMAPSGPPVVQIHNHYDERVGVAAIRSPAGQQEVLNILRSNRNAIR